MVDHQLETIAIHAGNEPDATGSRALPIHQTTSFVFHDADHAANLFNLAEVGYIYSRLTNPTVAALQTRMAALEGGVGAVCTSSGHAAQILALFALMEPGCNIVSSNQLYGGSINQFSNAIRKFGWSCKFVDPDDKDALKAAADDSTRAYFIEGLANPGGVITDVKAIADIAHAAGVPLIVDNTMATPFLLRPIEHGADIIIHSTTKFLSGNGTSIGGVMVDGGTFDWVQCGDKFPSLTQPLPDYHGAVLTDAVGNMALTFHGIAVGLRDLGAALSPMNAWITALGIETGALRMARHCENALTVAKWLETHDKVAWVSYAGLESSPYHGRAKTYMNGLGGAVFTFGLNGGYEAGKQVVNSVKLLSHVANVGDAKSLIIHPASTTHRQLADEARTLAGAADDVVRLSIGIENVNDIIADLKQAFMIL